MGGVPGPTPAHGLALFLQRGTVEWMNAWSKLTHFSQVEKTANGKRCQHQESGGKSEVFSVLVEMAMQAEVYGGQRSKFATGRKRINGR